ASCGSALSKRAAGSAGDQGSLEGPADVRVLGRGGPGERPGAAAPRRRRQLRGGERAAGAAGDAAGGQLPGWPASGAYGRRTAGRPPRPGTEVPPAPAGGHQQHSTDAVSEWASRGDLIPFLDLCSALATSVGDAVFSSQLLAPLCRLCVAALASAEHDVLKPALLFLQRLLTTRAVQLGEADVGQLAQAVVASFSQWPRRP
ncbi:unnamed protein product, partial [Effrenium voratum]